jgi:hypothetical protein
VHEGDGRLQPLVAQVGEELLDLARDEHALVDEGAGRQRREVHAVVAHRHLVFDPLAGHEAQPVEVDARLAPRPGKEQHPEDGHAVAGLAADHGVVVGDVAPAQRQQALLAGDLLDVARRPVGVGRRQEGDATGVGPGRRELDVADLAQQAVGHLYEDTGAVADVRLGVGGASVVEVAQRRQPETEDLVAAAAVHVGHEADTAGVVLEPRVVETLLGRAGHSSRFRARRNCQGFGAAVRGRRWPSGNGLTA